MAILCLPLYMKCLLYVQDLSVEVMAVLNDTTGTLLAGSYLDKECAIGLIMGTFIYFKNMIKNKWQKNDNNQNEVNMIIHIRRLQNSNN